MPKNVKSKIAGSPSGKFKNSLHPKDQIQEIPLPKVDRQEGSIPHAKSKKLGHTSDQSRHTQPKSDSSERSALNGSVTSPKVGLISRSVIQTDPVPERKSRKSDVSRIPHRKSDPSEGPYKKNVPSERQPRKIDSLDRPPPKSDPSKHTQKSDPTTRKSRKSHQSELPSENNDPPGHPTQKSEHETRQPRKSNEADRSLHQSEQDGRQARKNKADGRPIHKSEQDELPAQKNKPDPSGNVLVKNVEKPHRVKSAEKPLVKSSEIKVRAKSVETLLRVKSAENKTIHVKDADKNTLRVKSAKHNTLSVKSADRASPIKSETTVRSFRRNDSIEHTSNKSDPKGKQHPKVPFNHPPASVQSVFERSKPKVKGVQEVTIRNSVARDNTFSAIRKKAEATKGPQAPLDPKIKKVQSFQITVAFSFLYRIMSILDRFPLKYIQAQDGGFKFVYVPNEMKAIWFRFVNYLLTCIFVLILINVASILVNFPSHDGMEVPGVTANGSGVRTSDELRAEELYLFHRHIIVIIFIITEFIQAIVGGWNFYSKREFAAKYMSLWSVAAQNLEINPTVGLRAHMFRIFGFHSIIYILIVLCSLSGYIPITTGYPSTFIVIICRVFYPQIHTFEYMWLLRILAWVVLVYILLCGKIYILAFHFHCKMIRNSYRVWNKRLDRILHGKLARDVKQPSLSSYAKLFKDHVCLLDLMQGADELYGNAVMMYYGTQILSICFQLYYLQRSQFGIEFRGCLRQYDGIAITLYMIQTIYLMSHITVGAAEVGEEASDGLEVIRGKGMLGDRATEELYFMLSMYVSYSGYPETALTAGKYFVLDKAFIVKLISIVFSYFIILLQFTPALQYEGRAYKRFITEEVVTSILNIFEQTTPPPFAGNRTIHCMKGSSII